MLTVSVNSSEIVSFTCTVDSLERDGLSYMVDWHWGKMLLADQEMTETNGTYISVLSETYIDRLAFGDKVKIIVLIYYLSCCFH